MPNDRLRHASRLLAACAASATALSLALPALPAAAVDTCSAPVLRDALVTQGLSSYSALARGKTTLVKYFMSLPNSPDCGTKSIRITGGSLVVSRAAGDTVTVPGLLQPSAGSLATLPTYGTLQQDAPGDPVFVVPGTALSPAGTGAFTAGFTATLSYAVTDSATGVTTSGTTAPITTNVDGKPVAAPVGARSKPIRVLVVPMGDGGSSTAQWDNDTARSDTGKVINGMQQLSRVAPVADGVTALGGTGGVQYVVSSGLINLGLHTETVNGLPIPKNYMPGGTFCGSGSEFGWVSQQLSSFLVAWNKENPAATADRALGVVSERISVGPTTSAGTCSDGTYPAEGIASVGGTFAWVRAVGPSTTSPGTSATRQGTTGAVAALELLHTYGGSTASTTLHSTSVVADGQAVDVGRAFNTVTRARLATNRALMRFDRSPWDDYSTLYEQRDWDYLGCALRLPPGSKVQPACGTVSNTSAAAATNGTSAATGAIVLAGTTDGTTAGTHAFTYFDSDQPTDGTDDTSAYKVLFYDTNGTRLGTTGIRVSSSESVHSNGTDNDAVSPGLLSFGVSLPGYQQEPLVALPGRTSRFELRRFTTSTSSTLLYAADLKEPPTYVASSDVPVFNGATNHSRDGVSSAPAVSPDGLLVARSVAGQIRFAPTADGTALLGASVPGTQAAWSRDGATLAVVDQGAVRTYPVSRTGPTGLALGAAVAVYDPLEGGVLKPAADPVFTRTGSSLLLSAGGDLVTIDLTSPLLPASAASCALDGLLVATGAAVPPCTYLTSTGTDSHPSVSPGGDTVAFQRGSDAAAAVLTLLLSSPAGSQVQRIAGAQAPTYAGSQLLVSTAAGLRAYDTGSFATSSPVTAAPGDTAASTSSTAAVVAFQRGADVYLATVRVHQVTVSVTGPAKEYRLSVYKSKDGTSDPVLVDLGGTRSGSTTTFTATYPADRVPDGASTVYVTTDGFATATRVEDGTPAGYAGQGNVAIYAPVSGSVYLTHQRVPVAGGATDPTGDPAQAITWTLAGPAGSAYATPRTVGSGPVLTDLDPGTSGWAAGSYVLTAAYLSPLGLPVANTTTFTIVQDTDGDGLPDAVDNRTANPCFPADAVTDAANAQADPDGDRIPSITDASPCVSEVNLLVRFTASTVGTGSGNYVKLHIDSATVNLAQATTANTVITDIGGFEVRIPAVVVQYNAGSITASFDKSLYQAAVARWALNGTSSIPVGVRIGSTPVPGYGFDPDSPTNL